MDVLQSTEKEKKERKGKTNRWIFPSKMFLVVFIIQITILWIHRQKET